ncbi:MAG: hypothetical protein NW205_01995 [Hyphomicrobiaceae bacterium]|nr:hypothetical protein [Hyphomicrobiaceae bacterium]
MPHRVADDGRALAAFASVVDVVCPACHRRARIVAAARPVLAARPGPGRPPASPARLTCANCALTRSQDLPPGVMAMAALRVDGTDPYFGLDLWLVEATRHGIVFAYNAEHLDALAAFVGADLRERHRLAPTTLRNRTFQARLPRWMKLARNRQHVLAALARLRQRLAET